MKLRWREKKKTSSEDSERWMTVEVDVENRYTLGKYETNDLYFLQST